MSHCSNFQRHDLCSSKQPCRWSMFIAGFFISGQTSRRFLLTSPGVRTPPSTPWRACPPGHSTTSLSAPSTTRGRASGASPSSPCPPRAQVRTKGGGKGVTKYLGNTCDTWCFKTSNKIILGYYNCHYHNLKVVQVS